MPSYELEAPGQPSQAERIEYALRHHPVFREASVKEGLISAEKLQQYKAKDERRASRDAVVASRSSEATSSSRKVESERDGQSISNNASELQPPRRLQNVTSRPSSLTLSNTPPNASNSSNPSQSSGGSDDAINVTNSKHRRGTMSGKVRSRL